MKEFETNEIDLLTAILQKYENFSLFVNNSNNNTWINPITIEKNKIHRSLITLL